jgi:ATP-dependent helicase/nuclease subunit B
MGLRLIYGRAGTGKSTYCLNEIKERLKEGGNTPLVLVVPEQFSLQSEKNLVRVVGAGGIIRAEVLSFRRMAYRVFNEVGGLNRRHINSAGKCMLMYRIVDRLKDNLEILSGVVEQKGFINTLCDTVAELKRYDLSPEALKDACERIGGESLLKDKLAEISLIYGEFEKELHYKYIDSEDDLTLLADKIEQSRIFDEGEIWIDEFSGFTPQEYKVIGNLLRKVRRVNISLCTDCLIDEGGIDCADVFAPVKKTAARLIGLAKSHGIDVEKPVKLEDSGIYGTETEIRHLERNFFSFPYEAYMKPTKNLTIFSSTNIFSEVEETARAITALCRDEGLRYSEIAVVSRNLEGYEKVIASVFSEYGIPYFIDCKKDISGHPLVQLILSLFDIFSSNWTYQAVFRYLKTGLTGIDRDSIDIIENYVLAFGIRGKLWTQEQEWDYRMDIVPDNNGISENESLLIKRINEIRKSITTPLINFYEKAKGRNKSRDICTYLYEFLCDIGVPQSIEKQVDEFREAGEFGLANEYSQIWNMLMEVLDQVVDVIGDERITLSRFHRILEIGIGEYKMGLVPPSVDQVLVGSIERSKGHDISALFVLGVNDGVFPAFTNCEGIFSDRDRETLGKLGLELAQDTRTSAFEEQFLIYSTLTTSKKYLRLSYPIADHEGRTMRPSIVISRIRKVFPNITESSNIAAGSIDRDNIEMVTVPVPTFNELVSRMRSHAEGIKVNTIWWDVYRWYSNKEFWKDKCDTVMSGLFYTNQVEAIKQENARKIYSRPLYTSVSRLESYIACPFSYFIRYGLKAKERRVFNLSAPDVGTFIHTVIDRFSTSLNKSGKDWRTVDKEWCGKEISNIVDNLLSGLSRPVLRSTGRYRYLSERLKRILTRAIWVIAEHIRRGGFEPIGYELAFGQDGEFPPIVLQLPSGEEVRLTGRVDRVDALKAEEGTYIRIVDYKSGSRSFKLSDVYYGLQIQLVAYMDAILNGTGRKALPAGIFYFRIDDPIIKSGSSISEEEIEKAIMKELKMKGLILADVKLVREMDRSIEGDSLIVPARINKDDTLGRSSAASIEQFDMIFRYVKKLLANAVEEMLRGNIAISPYKRNKSISCMYCPYPSICQFDQGLKDNNYRIMKDIKDEDLWRLIGNT